MPARSTTPISPRSEIEEAVRRGYPNDLGKSFERQLHIALLMTQMGYLARHVRIPEHPEVPLYAQGLRSTLEWLRRSNH